MSQRDRMEEELDRDIQEHIELETEENIERGMSPEEARFAALRKFGNIVRVKEDTRRVWGWTWLDTLLSDIKYGLKRIGRAPGTAALAVLSLATAMLCTLPGNRSPGNASSVIVAGWPIRSWLLSA